MPTEVWGMQGKIGKYAKVLENHEEKPRYDSNTIEK